MRRALAVTALASVALAGAAAAAPPELPKVPKDCHEWNDLLGIDNVRSCDDPPGSAAEAAPPQLVGVHQREDGAVCVTISYQVPQCTPPLD